MTPETEIKKLKTRLNAIGLAMSIHLDPETFSKICDTFGLIETIGSHEILYPLGNQKFSFMDVSDNVMGSDKQKTNQDNKALAMQYLMSRTSNISSIDLKNDLQKIMTVLNSL